MTVNVHVSVSFEAESTEDAQAVVDAISFPEGAQVNVSAMETLTAGTVTDGEVVAPEALPEISALGVANDDAPVPTNGDEPVETEAEPEEKTQRRDVLAIAAETLFGAVAALCSLIGVAMAVLSFIAGRRNAAEKAEIELHEQLIAEQRRSEQLSAELHALRMGEP